MKVVRDLVTLRAAASRLQRIAFVPTMGGLHEGHLSLIRLARRVGGAVAVSIFVNRLQFQPHEDFDKYPRAFERDRELLLREGVDLLFSPEEKTLYPEPQTFVVNPGRLGDELEGFYRPGFFTGVATVVLKLFHLVQPAIAVFGKKDYQQLFLVRRMVRQLNLPIEIVEGETVREADGLAMSSRNSYLSDSERVEAPRLYRLLRSVASGAHTSDSAIKELLQAGWKPDYIEVRRRADFKRPRPGDKELVVLGAARLGTTRLIDNVEF